MVERKVGGRARARGAAAIAVLVVAILAMAAILLGALTAPPEPAAGGAGASKGRPSADEGPTSATAASRAPAPRTAEGRAPAPRDPWPRPRWRDSTAVGIPEAGRLERGVRFPREGRHFFTWDPVERESPNRPWRRWGTDELVRTVLDVVADHRRAHPGAPRLGIGDLSRPHGGDFGPQFGIVGHATHQNGLDADVYYPLRSGAERAPLSVDEVDLRLSQDLVDRFVAAGAEKVYVGPATGLTGPPEVVQAIPYHDNHLHVRIADPD